MDASFSTAGIAATAGHALQAQLSGEAQFDEE
jgi:hypothetical protein